MSVYSTIATPSIIKESSRGYDCVRIEDELLSSSGDTAPSFSLKKRGRALYERSLSDDDLPLS